MSWSKVDNQLVPAAAYSGYKRFHFHYRPPSLNGRDVFRWSIDLHCYSCQNPNHPDQNVYLVAVFTGDAVYYKAPPGAFVDEADPNCVEWLGWGRALTIGLPHNATKIRNFPPKKVSQPNTYQIEFAPPAEFQLFNAIKEQMEAPAPGITYGHTLIVPEKAKIEPAQTWTGVLIQTEEPTTVDGIAMPFGNVVSFELPAAKYESIFTMNAGANKVNIPTAVDLTNMFD